MAEIKKGSFTLPGEAGFESLTLKMAEKGSRRNLRQRGHEAF